LEPKRAGNWELWVSAVTVFLTVSLMIAYYSRWFSFATRFGPFRIIHYIAFAGTFFIAFGVVLFVVLKRRFASRYRMLLRVHVFGNLLSFLLVSLHFAGQVGRPADIYPEFGTGLAMYIGMVLSVATGLVLRFKVFRSLSPVSSRFVHAGLAFVFYTIIVVHILHGLSII
jgi:hypothetical protein